MATVGRCLCALRSGAGAPAGLRFPVTHSINHFTEVGHAEQEVHLKSAGAARAGRRRRPAIEAKDGPTLQEGAAAGALAPLPGMTA